MTTVDHDQLLKSAEDFTDRALKAYTEDDTKVVLTDAAIGLEHLCKAYLCSLHPALLMEIKNGQLDSLLHLTGHGAKVKDHTKGPRTINARTAIERVQTVARGLKVPQDRIRQLIEVRDGVVHAGYLNEAETREILTACLRLSDELYDLLRVAQDERWGRHAELVASLISQSLSEIERRVRHRMAAAKLRIDELLKAIPVTEHQSMLMNARQSYSSVAYSGAQETVTGKCPVCGHSEAVYVGIQDSEPHVQVNPDGRGGQVETILGTERFLHAESFHCGVCSLDLQDPDELRAARLEIEHVISINRDEPEEEFSYGDSDLDSEHPAELRAAKLLIGRRISPDSGESEEGFRYGDSDLDVTDPEELFTAYLAEKPYFDLETEEEEETLEDRDDPISESDDP